MDYEKLAAAVRLCGSTPVTFQCLGGCPYYSGRDVSQCIPRMTTDAATAITDLLARAEAVEARCKRLDEARERANEACAKWEYRAEKAERERDAAVKWIRAFTESIDQPCVGCKHDTGDFVSLGVCGGCSKENDKWEWRGQKEE